MSQPQRVEGRGDGFQTARKGKRRGMVINDEGNAVFGAEQPCYKCAGSDHVMIEFFVQIPPDELQDFEKIFGSPLGWGHAAGEGRVAVVMPAAKGRDNELSCAVQNSIVSRSL